MINSKERPAKGPMVFKSFVACYSFVVILNNFIHLNNVSHFFICSYTKQFVACQLNQARIAIMH